MSSALNSPEMPEENLTGHIVEKSNNTNVFVYMQQTGLCNK